jgi:undecaprenyl pyrophosphate synthase
MLEFCFAAGVKTMTFYAFSIANFQRSNEEVQAVMSLIQRVCSRLMEPGSAAERFGINVRLCGTRALLPTEIVQTIERAEKTLGSNAERVLNICIAYGSRDEITSSFRAAIMKHHHQLPASGKDNPSKHNITGSSEHQKMPHLLSSRRITVDALDDEMFTAGCPPMDLLVRTSGTNRLSDFMLWQCHQDTEIVIFNANWPELTAWNTMQALSQWLLRASLSDLVTSVRKSPDILQIMISCFYIIFLLLMRVSNNVCWYLNVVRNDPAYILRDKEVSLEMIHKDTRRLNKLPTHLSVIIRLTDASNAFDIAISTVADFITLCISVGIPLLSVYERTGEVG